MVRFAINAELRNILMLFVQSSHRTVIFHAQVQIAAVGICKSNHGIHQIGIAQLLQITFEFHFHGLPFRNQIGHDCILLLMLIHIILHACNHVNSK